MNRRSLITSASCALLGGAAGCLRSLDGTNGEVDSDCERFESRTRSMSGSAWIAIYTVDSVPDGAAVIYPVREGLYHRKYLGEALSMAACSDEVEDIKPNSAGKLVDYTIPSDQYYELRDTLGESRKHDDNWYVEYDGEVYRLDLLLAIED